MKRMIILAALLSVPAAVFAQPLGGNNPAGGSMPSTPSLNQSGGSSFGKGGQEGGQHKGGGRHARIHRAMNLCSRAEEQIHKAADDYGGHKEKAGELIRQAKEELKAGLEYAQQHKKQGGGQGQPSGGSSSQPEGPGSPQQ